MFNQPHCLLAYLSAFLVALQLRVVCCSPRYTGSKDTLTPLHEPHRRSPYLVVVVVVAPVMIAAHRRLATSALFCLASLHTHAYIYIRLMYVVTLHVRTCMRYALCPAIVSCSPTQPRFCFQSPHRRHCCFQSVVALLPLTVAYSRGSCRLSIAAR